MRNKRRLVKPIEPVKLDVRICFSIAYFTSEADAERYAAWVEALGRTYNGGWFDGTPCGRDPSFDYTDPHLGRLYAVTA